MNPELQRNLWLEIGPRRLIMMAGVLALLFLAGNVMGGASGVRSAAEGAFYAVTVFWGARAAGQSVVGEIRDRTWDTQRLSSLTPFAMTWGKLAGATSYAWVGGVFCLVVLIPLTWAAFGVGQAFADLCYFLAMGLTAQTVALFASLVAMRRRQIHSRIDVFLFQILGILAAFGVWQVWQVVAPGSTSPEKLETLSWWGMRFDAPGFYLVSLAVFLLWTFTGCYRLMRHELQVENGPLVWTGFLVFMIFYVTGFDSWRDERFSLSDMATIRCLAAGATSAVLAYLAILLEPKDRVLFRWLRETLAQRRFLLALSRIQGWMIAYAASVLFTLAAVVCILLRVPDRNAALALAASALGFLTRDIGVFMFFALMPGQRRSDLSAVVTLIVLYAVAPQIADGLSGVGLFYPVPAGLAVLFAWTEAACVWALLVYSRMHGVLPQPVRK